MDEKDRSCCAVRGEIPGHLMFAVDGWLEAVVAKGDGVGVAPDVRETVVEVVRLRDALFAGTLSAAQIAELAAGAVGWLQESGRGEVGEEAGRRACAVGELVALRDRAFAAASGSDGRARVVTVDAETRDVVRAQTLMVLEFGHDPFEEIRDLHPPELLAVAAIFRDAFAVLDTIGWLPASHAGPMRVAITPSHLAQLEQRRAEMAMSLLDRLDSRDELTDPGDIAEADAAIRADRRAAHALLQIIHAHRPV
jgi:hypothetical protein